MTERGFPFGALSSFERLAYTKTKRPCAEREAPHANSLPGAGICPTEAKETNGELFDASIRKAIAACLLCVLAVSGMAASPVDVHHFPDADSERRYRALVNEFRCPKCLNVNISGSDAPIAQDLRAAVYRLAVLEGRSDREVRDFLQARYGDFRALRPAPETRHPVALAGARGVRSAGPSVSWPAGCGVSARRCSMPRTAAGCRRSWTNNDVLVSRSAARTGSHRFRVGALPAAQLPPFVRRGERSGRRSRRGGRRSGAARCPRCLGWP